MRIISGRRRGQKLCGFDGMDVRPTTDRVRESIFNLIQEYVSGAYVLDMFGGSGALSLEALSRGAAEAVCVDADPRSIAIIKKNAHSLRFDDECKTVCADCMKYLERANRKFDIIFLDPPYNKGFIESALGAIVKYSLLSENGIAVLESDGTDFHGESEGLEMLKQRKYGRTYVTVYTLKDSGK